MSIKAITGAPQLTRLIRELPLDVLSGLLASDLLTVRDAHGGAAVSAADSSLETATLARRQFAELDEDRLASVERDALRITRVCTPQADALHLRLADGPGFECRAELEALPGALARAASSAASRPALFRSLERAMQMRSYRENRTVYEAHDLHSARPLLADQIDLANLEDIVAKRLALKGGCELEVAELPSAGQTSHEIM
jgi:hypothetical protein